MSGSLRVVGTPIGNLDDLSPRAAAAISDADLLVCEDTRVTRKLLTRAPSRAKLVALNARTEAREAERIAGEAARGKRVVLVSDAGMPGISDPGRRVVAAARAQGVAVEVIPGPSAALTALVASGFPSARFCVEGFLPQTGKARRRRLEGLAKESRTLVVFEGPHRLADTLADMAATFGRDRPAALCRELTKLYEEVVVATIGELLDRFAEEAPRGECTLVVEGTPEVESVVDADELRQLIADEIEAGATKRDAVAEVARRTGASKRVVFDLANET